MKNKEKTKKKEKLSREEKAALREKKKAERAQKRAEKKAQRKAEKIRKRVIKEANKLLIPAPKRTLKSMGLICFDPAGAFRFDGNRWIRIYKVSGSVDKAVEAVARIKSKMRVTHCICGREEDDEYFITLTAEGEVYKLIQEQFEEDEKVLKELIGIEALSFDEAADVITAHLRGVCDKFDHKAFIKSKKDLLKEIAPQIREERSHLCMDDRYAKSFFFMEYPSSLLADIFSVLREEGCRVFMSFDLVGISDEDRSDYIRTLEKRYSAEIGDDGVIPFMNISGQLSFICPTEEIMQDLTKKVTKAYSDAGFLLAPVFGAQRESFLSQTTFGMFTYRNLRNVSIKTMDLILRRKTDVSDQNEI